MDLPLLVGFAAGGALVPAGVIVLRRLVRGRRYLRERARIEAALAGPLGRLERSERAYRLHDRIDRLLRAGQLDRLQHEALEARILALSERPAQRRLPVKSPLAR